MLKFKFSILVLLGSFSFSFSHSLFESLTSIEKSSDSNIELNGYARGSMVGWNEKYDYTSLFGEFSLQGEFNFGKAYLYSDVRFRSGTQFNAPFHIVEIKEAYAGLKSDKLDLFLGNQIISWGRTDGFNPTNNITPNNYFFLSANPNDQKLPNFMLRAKYQITPQLSWELIGIPLYKPSIYKYDLFEMGENVSFSSAVLPDKLIKNSSVATRINFDLPSIGFSFSWFKGFDPFYGYRIENIDFTTGQPVITNSASFYKKNCFGFDFDLPVSSWIFRSEGAINLTNNYKENMYIPYPDLSYVVGIEHDFNGFLTILQYIGKHTLYFNPITEPLPTNQPDPIALMQYAQEQIYFESTLFNRKIFHQQNEQNHALSITVSNSFAHETIKTELTGYYNITSKEYMIRPKLTWIEGNGLEITMGGNWMYGPNNSVFNYASQLLNGAFIEFKTSF